MLDRLLRDLAEATPLALLLGAALGAALVGLLTGTVGESSNESLEVLVLGSLQVLAPIGVTLIWILRLAPLRVEAAARRHLRASSPGRRGLFAGRQGQREMTVAALTALALFPWFEGALLLGGLLATPRAGLGLGSEVAELFRLMNATDLGQGLLRAGLFAAAAEAVCLRKGAQVRATLEELPRLIADAIPEALLAVTALEGAWLSLVPLHGTYA
ncbi:MAG: hypothetical protein VKI81_09375 [Synechococcaceae cyanobacterium]|nr:hypothetical protein [Synechococcaceae cyanobacterium]